MVAVSDRKCLWLLGVKSSTGTCWLQISAPHSTSSPCTACQVCWPWNLLWVPHSHLQTHLKGVTHTWARTLERQVKDHKPPTVPYQNETMTCLNLYSCNWAVPQPLFLGKHSLLQPETSGGVETTAAAGRTCCCKPLEITLVPSAAPALTKPRLWAAFCRWKICSPTPIPWW